MTSPRDLRLLAYFVQVVRAGSIRGAANQLALSPAVISEALSELEAILGVTLLKRTTRTMALTDVGHEVLEHAAVVVAAADQAMLVGGRSTQKPKGRVRITLPIELSIAWLPPLLRAFEDKYPGVRVEVHADDAVVALPSSEFDLAIRANYTRSKKSGSDVCACAPS